MVIYKAHYLALLAENKLNDELLSMDQQMNARYDVLVKQLMEERSVNKELKEKDQMRWVQEMNNIKNSVEKNLLDEFINI
ncbi:MAG: TnpV protein [Faecalibacillus intestinalis]|uniref:TnpV protein n=1 Tax=Faecalibacillus intestinalis TaxID=1982626 RepID=UPI00399FAA9C